MTLSMPCKVLVCSGYILIWLKYKNYKGFIIHKESSDMWFCVLRTRNRKTNLKLVYSFVHTRVIRAIYLIEALTNSTCESGFWCMLGIPR